MINTSLHPTLKLKNFIYFGILSIISWANTFKNQEFRQKIENFQQHLKICTLFIIRKKNNTSLHHTLKIENFSIFWILSLISWANTFKTKEFRQKIETFHQH